MTDLAISMPPSHSVAVPRAVTWPAIVFFSVVGLLAVWGGTWLINNAREIPHRPTDIDSFLAVARLIHDGNGAMIHDPATILAELQKHVLAKRPIIWNYPPHASLLTSVLFVASDAVARAIIAVGTVLAAFLLIQNILPKDLPKSLHAVLLLAFVASPPVLCGITHGQPACLIGISAFLAGRLALAGNYWAAPLAMLAMAKPHVAGPFFAVLFAMRAETRRPLLAGAVLTLLLTLAAEFVLGDGATMRFIAAIRDASAYVAQNKHYPTFRMITFASEFGLQWPNRSTLIPIGISILIYASSVAFAGKSAIPSDRSALVIASTSYLWMTPYLYDYDMILPMLAVAYALTQPGLSDRTAKCAIIAIIAASAIGNYGQIIAMVNIFLEPPMRHAVGVLSVCILTWMSLQIQNDELDRNAHAEAT